MTQNVSCIKTFLYWNHKVCTVTAGQMCTSVIHTSISIHTQRRSLLKGLNSMTILPFHRNNFTRIDSLCFVWEDNKMSDPLWLELPLYLILFQKNTRLITECFQTMTSPKEAHYSALLSLTAESAEIKHSWRCSRDICMLDVMWYDFWTDADGLTDG